VKVRHVIPSVAEQSGGPGQAIVPMCLALQQSEIEVVIATTSSGAEVPPIKQLQGVPIINMPAQFGASFKYSRPLAMWLKQNVGNFDLVHIHAVFNHACTAAATVCRRQRVPYIIRPLGTLDPWSMKQKRWRKNLFWYLLGKRMLLDAAAVHYTSAGELEAAERSLGLNHGWVVPLGVDTARVDNLNGSFLDLFPAPRQKEYVLVLSRLDQKKGLEVLLDAFCRLKHDARFSTWRLVIAGDGPSRYVATLKKIVNAHKADNSVVFTGRLDQEAKLAALSHASLLALPSHHENFGLCAMEALAMGVPVLISSNVNLAPQVERAKAGWIVKVDTGSIQAALAEALTVRGERDRRGRNGKMLAAKFDWQVVAQELVARYSQIV